MKENEIMIGDWVYLVKDYGPIKKEVLKLDGLDLYRVFDGVLGVEPIPLTTEILEKNGFDFDGNEIYKLGNYQLVIEYREGSIFGWIFCHKKQLNYVHELQHILRLCRMNGMADNFKI
jgi:hypothetical protein